jgi:hypothetical protein
MFFLDQHMERVGVENTKKRGMGINQFLKEIVWCCML